MKRAIFYFRIIFCFAPMIPVNVHALVINDVVFAENGGELDNVKGSIEFAYAPMQKKSFESSFAATGDIGTCSSTWIGDSKDKTKSYFLTAAHCVEYNDPLSVSGYFSGKFLDKNKRIIAQNGIYFLGPYRVNRPQGFVGASTDIALLVLNKKANIKNEQGKDLMPPWLNDGPDELEKKVSFVGYGEWGVGGSVASGFQPSTGSLRAWGESKVDSIPEMGYALSASYQPSGKSAAWARLTNGDNGSVWWQQHHGFWTIAGVANGGNLTISTAARVSLYIHWIKSLYPEVSTLTDMTTLTAVNPLMLPDLSLDTKNSSVSYTVPIQSGARGPLTDVWDSGPGFSRIVLFLRDMHKSEQHPVIIRAWRDVGCGNAPMNSAVSCGDKKSALVLQFRPDDNLSLPPGHYQGSFYIQARGWHDPHYHNTLQLIANIDTTNLNANKPLYPAYRPGRRYRAGERVTADNGLYYQCKAFPFTHLCAGDARFYGPGIGTHWWSAWIALK